MDGGGGGLLQALEVRRLLGRRLTAGGAGLAGEAVVSAVTSNSLERGGGSKAVARLVSLCLSVSQGYPICCYTMRRYVRNELL